MAAAWPRSQRLRRADSTTRDRSFDEDGAADLARRIAALIAEPIDGIAEPLEAWVGLSLRRVADDVLTVRIDVERAANVLARGAGVPYMILSDQA